MGFSIGKINNITMTTKDGANIIFENIVDCDLTMNRDFCSQSCDLNLTLGANFNWTPIDESTIEVANE